MHHQRRPFWVTVEHAPGRTADHRIEAASAWSAGWLYRQLNPGSTVRLVRPVPHPPAGGLMATIDISARIVGDKELSAALARLSSHDIPKAIKAGVRDAARAGRTTLAKSIGQRYSLSAGRIKQDVSQPQFRDAGQTAIIRTSRKPITAMQFKARQTSKGLTMSIFRGERTLVKSGFIAKGKPFVRRGKQRMPIRVVLGPSIHAIYTGGHWAPALQARTELRIEEALENGIIRSLGGMARGYGRG